MSAALRNVAIDSTAHRQLKIASAQLDIPMGEIVERWIATALPELKKHGARSLNKSKNGSPEKGNLDVPAAPTPIGSDQSSTTPVASPPSDAPPVKTDAGVSSVNEGAPAAVRVV